MFVTIYSSRKELAYQPAQAMWKQQRIHQPIFFWHFGYHFGSLWVVTRHTSGFCLMICYVAEGYPSHMLHSAGIFTNIHLFFMTQFCR